MKLMLSRLDDSKFFVIKNTDAAELRTCKGRSMWWDLNLLLITGILKYATSVIQTHMIHRNLFDLCDEKYVYTGIFYFAVALRPNAGHGLLILEVSRSHTTTHRSR